MIGLDVGFWIFGVGVMFCGILSAWTKGKFPTYFFDKWEGIPDVAHWGFIGIFVMMIISLVVLYFKEGYRIECKLYKKQT